MSLSKMHFKMSFAKWWPFCLGLLRIVDDFADVVTATGTAVTDAANFVVFTGATASVYPRWNEQISWFHYSDVMMSTVMSQITVRLDCLITVCSGANQRTYQNSTSLAFVRGIYRWPVNSPHKGPITRKMFPSMTSSCTRTRKVFFGHVRFTLSAYLSTATYMYLAQMGTSICMFVVRTVLSFLFILFIYYYYHYCRFYYLQVHLEKS